MRCIVVCWPDPGMAGAMPKSRNRWFHVQGTKQQRYVMPLRTALSPPADGSSGHSGHPATHPSAATHGYHAGIGGLPSKNQPSQGRISSFSGRAFSVFFGKHRCGSQPSSLDTGCAGRSWEQRDGFLPERHGSQSRASEHYRKKSAQQQVAEWRGLASAHPWDLAYGWGNATGHLFGSASSLLGIASRSCNHQLQFTPLERNPSNLMVLLCLWDLVGFIPGLAFRTGYRGFITKAQVSNKTSVILLIKYPNKKLTLNLGFMHSSLIKRLVIFFPPLWKGFSAVII